MQLHRRAGVFALRLSQPGHAQFVDNGTAVGDNVGGAFLAAIQSHLADDGRIAEGPQAHGLVVAQRQRNADLPPSSMKYMQSQISPFLNNRVPASSVWVSMRANKDASSHASKYSARLSRSALPAWLSVCSTNMRSSTHSSAASNTQ